MSISTTPPLNRPPLLEASQINKTFLDKGKVQVLAGLNIRVNSGEMIAIIGVSGTGKSTLLHILGTLERPTSGKLFYDNTDILSFSDKDLCAFRNRTIGFIFQFHHLLPEFNALENIMMPGLIAGFQKDMLLDHAHTLMGQVGLAHRFNHKIGELSGGEQQRVAIARALIMKPKILLADEPTGNLDPKTGRLIFDLLGQLNESNNVATIMVTHNHRLADKMNRCLTLENGQLHNT